MPRWPGGRSLPRTMHALQGHQRQRRLRPLCSWIQEQLLEGHQLHQCHDRIYGRHCSTIKRIIPQIVINDLDILLLRSGAGCWGGTTRIARTLSSALPCTQTGLDVAQGVTDAERLCGVASPNIQLLIPIIHNIDGIWRRLHRGSAHRFTIPTYSNEMDTKRRHSAPII